MTWVAVGVAGVGMVSQMNAADKAANQQFDANINAMNAQRQSAAQIQPWATRGSNAADELQALLGIGSNDSEADLINRYMGQYTRTVKKKKKGGLLGKLKDIDAQADLGGRILGIKGVQGPRAGTVVDWGALNARVKQEMEKQKATRERSDYGMLRKEFTNEDFIKDPGYNFRLEEGNRGVQSSLAARGGLFSGQAGKELNRYNQGFASNEFGAAADRANRYKTNIYNMLSGNSIQGQGAAMNAANMGNLAPFQINSGNIASAGTMGQANALSSGLSQGLNYWQSANALNSPKKQNPNFNTGMAGAPYQGSGMYS